MQQGSGPPEPGYRVRWPKFSGWSGWKECLDAPRVEEGCLILKTDPHRLLWVPLHTVVGPIEIERL